MQQYPPSHASGEPFVIAGWRVDPAARSLSKSEQTRKLEPGTMAVLQYLAAKPGRVVGQQELEDIARCGSLAGPDAVSAAIIELRDAFGDGAHNATIIETVPGTGYRLIARVLPPDDDPADETGPVGRHPHAGDESQPSVKPAALNGLSFIEWRTAALLMVVMMAAAVLWFEPWSEPRVEPASIERMALALPDRPSIAVMPFTNLSEDESLDSLVDGMTEGLIIDLSGMAALFVVARDPVFEYKGREYRVRDVAENLSIRYLLEGGVRRAGVRVRLEVQLIDALSGDYVWAKTFDGVLDDVFALRQRIAHDVLEQLTVQPGPGEDVRRDDYPNEMRLAESCPGFGNLVYSVA